MWLVLCAASDIPALWAYQGLKARGLAPLELVSAEALAYSQRWEHRLGAEEVSTTITLADGRLINVCNVRGTLNRLTWIPTQHLNLSKEDDREYAIQELNAFFMSWLYALPKPVLNQPTPQGLAGQWRHASEWSYLASMAGLRVPSYTQASHDPIEDEGGERRLVSSYTPVKTIIVIGERLVGVSAPPDVLEGCLRLARLAETELLGIEFANDSCGAWAFAGATPTPDLRLGGPALLDTLAQSLQLH